MLQLTRRGVVEAAVLYPCIRPGSLLSYHLARPPAAQKSTSPSRTGLGTEQCAEAVGPMANPLTLVLLGDIMLGRYVNDAFTCDATRKTATFGSVLPYLQGLDPAHTIIAGNLECAVTNYTTPTPKAFNFRLSPSNADVLHSLRLGFVATANNHVLDYGQPGLKETNQVLSRLGIAQAGSGTQPAASWPAAVTTPSGHRVACLSFSDHYEEWAATNTTPGINFIDPGNFDPALLQQQVSAARAAGPDLVVVFIHWGPNWRWQPDKALRTLGRAFLDAGADLVFGTSPHHLQGVEVVGCKAIIYSGGSFVDDYSRDDDYRNDLSAVMVATYDSPASAAASAAQSAGLLVDVHHTEATSRDQGVGSPAAATTNAYALATAATAAAPVQAAAPAVATTVSANAAAATAPVHAAAAAGPEQEEAADAANKPSGGSAFAESRPCSSSSSMSSRGSGLVLHDLRALPIVITHHWRAEGGPFAGEGGGNPPYFSQVDFAEGEGKTWIASRLQQLSQALGNTRLKVLPGMLGVKLF